MKRKADRSAAYRADIVFRPALMPLEAAMLPAKDTKAYGTLRMVRRAYAWDADEADRRAFSGRRSE